MCTPKPINNSNSFFPPYMLKIHSNINIRSRDCGLLIDLPDKSQVMLVLAVSVSSALSQTDCTREVRSAVTLTQIKSLSHVTQKRVRLSSDPSRYFDIYLTLILKRAGQLQWEPRWPYHIPAPLCHQEIPQARDMQLAASFTTTPTPGCNSLSLLNTSGTSINIYGCRLT